MRSPELRRVDLTSLSDLVWELAKPRFTPRIIGVRGPDDEHSRYVDAPQVSGDATEIIVTFRDNGAVPFVISDTLFASGSGWAIWLPDGDELQRVVS